MHEQNIVHGDLKPDNLLYIDNVIKIADLGSSVKSKPEEMNIYEINCFG